MAYHSVWTADWTAIDTVLLDMDGTLLDLRFDNQFWQEQVPLRYAQTNAMPLAAAKAALAPLFVAKQGTLDWYCLDYWSRELKLDLEALKREVREDIRWLPHAEEFVLELRRRGKRVLLATNAHPKTLAVKNEHLDFHGHFDAVYSSHQFGAPKETQRFWRAFAAAEAFQPQRSLFVDDSVSVLRAAREYGIGHICAIAKPDSAQPRREITEFAAVDSVAELLASLRS
jgi:HAD superfamily hydrolase (TIGR01509 family)